MSLVLPVTAAVAAAACAWPVRTVAMNLSVPADDPQAGSPAAANVPGQPVLPLLVTALVMAALAFAAGQRLHPPLVAAAACWLVVCGVPLALIDLRVRRLPDALTGGALAGLAALLTAAAAATGHWQYLARSAGGAVTVAALFCVLALARPGSAGLGDAKLGLSTGALAAWFGWGVLLDSVFAGFLLAAVYGLWQVATGRASVRTGVLPFGPFLLAGCLGLVLLFA